MNTNDSAIRHIGRHLGYLSRGYRIVIDRRISDTGLSEAAALPLITIARLGNEVRPGIVADELGMEPASMVRVIDQLVASKLLSRGEDPSDRRAKILRLTEEGSAVATRIEELLADLRGEIFDDLPAEDLEATKRVFIKLAESLGRLNNKS